MRDFLSFLGFLLVVSLVLFNLATIPIGMTEHDRACSKRYNIEYVTPMFRVGCWLAQERKQ